MSDDKPLVQIGTENDDDPPLIIENPGRYTFEEGERELFREATDEEYQRYVDFHNALYDADHPEEDSS